MLVLLFRLNKPVVRYMFLTGFKMSTLLIQCLKLVLLFFITRFYIYEETNYTHYVMLVKVILLLNIHIY